MLRVPGLDHWRVYYRILEGSLLCFRRIDGAHLCHHEEYGCIGPMYSGLTNDQIDEVIRGLVPDMNRYDEENPMEGTHEWPTLSERQREEIRAFLSDWKEELDGRAEQ